MLDVICKNYFLGLLIAFLFGLSFTSYCKPKYYEISDSTESVIFNLKPGDLLVRPNKNFLPGSSKADGGRVIGHAALVIKGAEGSDISEVLSKALIVEAALFDQPTRKFITERSKQIRISTAEASFGKKYEGIRYRLRIPMNEMEREKLVNLAKGFIGQGRYSFFLTKSRLKKRVLDPEKKAEYSDYNWNCTALVWSLFNSVLKTDVDSNGGALVLPNDVLNSPVFNLPEGRIKF